MTTPVLGISHEIIINSKGYRVAPPVGGYTRFRASDFAPKISTGELTYAELDGWSNWTIDDWSGGICQERWKRGEENRFFDSHYVETRIPGRLTQGGEWESAHLTEKVNRFVEFNGDLYALTTASIQKYNNIANTWSQIAAQPAIDAIPFGVYLAIATTGGSANMFKMSTAEVLTEIAGTTGTTVLYTWKDALWRAAGNTLTSTKDISGSPTWTTTVAVGTPDSIITGMIVAEGYLIIFKEDGVFLYDGTNDPKEVVGLRGSRYIDNGKNPASLIGYLYYSEQARVRRMAGFYPTPTVQDKTPQLFGYPITELPSLTAEQWGWGIPVAFTSSPRWLFTAFKLAWSRDGAVLSYDGQAWHVLMRPYMAEPTALFYSSLHSKLFLSYEDHIPAHSGSLMFFQEYTTLAGTVKTYSVSWPGYLVSPWFDAGFADIDKAFKEVRISSRYGSATEKASIYYELDDSGTFTEIGEVNTSAYATVLPISVTDAAVAGKKIRLKIELQTGTATKTIEILDVTLRYLLRPPTVYGYRAVITISDNQEDMQGVPMDSFATQLANITTAESSVLPIPIDTPDGYSHKAYISSTKVIATRKKEGADT